MEKKLVDPIRVGMVVSGMFARRLTKLIPKRNEMIISKILIRKVGFIEGLGFDLILEVPGVVNFGLIFKIRKSRY